MDTESTIRKSLVTHSPEQTRAVAGWLANRAPLPAVIALVGQLGAGKTEFVKGLGGAFAIDAADICSATFVIICEYGTDRQLVHVDAYRLHSGEEINAIGFDEILEQDNALVAVEWADRIDDQLPAWSLWVRQELLGPTERRLTFEAAATSPWAAVLAEFNPEDFS